MRTFKLVELRNQVASMLTMMLPSNQHHWRLTLNTTVFSDPSAPPSDYTNLTWTNVAIGLAFIIFDVGVSSVLRLGISISLLVAALRCIGQLAVVATVLQSVFEHKNPWSVGGIAREVYFCRRRRRHLIGVGNSCVKFVRHNRNWCVQIMSTCFQSLKVC